MINEMPWKNMVVEPLETLVDTVALEDQLRKIQSEKLKLKSDHDSLEQKLHNTREENIGRISALAQLESQIAEKNEEIDNLKKISSATFTELENKILNMEKKGTNHQYTELNYQVLLYFIVGKKLELKGEELDKRVIGSTLLFLQQRKKVYDYLLKNNRPELAEPLKPVLMTTESTIK